MQSFKNILVVSRSTKNCHKVVKAGIELARRFGGRLFVLHVFHDPFSIDGWNLAVPSFKAEYQKMMSDAKEELNRMVASARQEGLPVSEEVRDGDPRTEISKVVERENIDLIIMRAHPEGRFEHFLFGHTNNALIRRLPASIMLVK